MNNSVKFGGGREVLQLLSLPQGSYEPAIKKFTICYRNNGGVLWLEWVVGGVPRLGWVVGGC